MHALNLHASAPARERGMVVFNLPVVRSAAAWEPVAGWAGLRALANSMGAQHGRVERLGDVVSGWRATARRTLLCFPDLRGLHRAPVRLHLHVGAGLATALDGGSHVDWPASSRTTAPVDASITEAVCGPHMSEASRTGCCRRRPRAKPAPALVVTPVRAAVPPCAQGHALHRKFQHPARGCAQHR